MSDNTRSKGPVIISPKQRWRAFVSTLTAFVFFLSVGSGVVLFVSPSGRMARGTMWRCLGHDKWEWIDIHIWFSTLLCVVAILHLVVNRRPMISHLGVRRGRRALRLEWLVAALICVAVYVYVVADPSPLSFLSDRRFAFKHSRSGDELSREREGGPRAWTEETKAAETESRSRGYGQMTLGEFCESNTLNLSDTVRRLTEEDFRADEKTTLRDVAGSRDMHPRDLARRLLQNGG